MQFKIDAHEIGERNPPFIIAELSANHNGSIELAKRNIDAAKKCGVNAIKLQTYNADSMTINCDKDDFIIKSGLWKGRKLYDLYEEAGTPFEWHAELFNHAKSLGLTIFSTPFDERAIDLLEELDAPAYKIASFEITDLPLIRYAAKTNKPLLISTGLASLSEIDDAVEAAHSSGCKELLLFHCISSYPAPIDQANLKQIQILKERYQVPVGLSDHTVGNVAALAATAIGAVAIEKHFTISRENIGPDSTFSIEPNEMLELVNQTKDVWRAIGSTVFIRPEVESENRIFRRSLYFVRDISAGSIIRSSDIRRIRPGFGIHPKYINEVIGRRAAFDVTRGDPVLWEKIIK
jgi:N-acetylneuraminate synthase